MSLPNKLTIIRVLLIPLFMVLNLCCGTVGLYFSLAVFLLAAATDWLDGRIARKSRRVTTFGKLMDPVADKLLITCALICFLASDQPFISAGVVAIIVAREFIVTGIRMLALEENRVIPAGFFGKVKTASQFFMVVAVIINQILEVYREPVSGGFWNMAVLVLVVIATSLTVLSGIDYIIKNKDLLTFK